MLPLVQYSSCFSKFKSQLFLIKKILNRISSKHLSTSMQQGLATFKYMKKWFREILRDIEQPWTPNWKKMQFFKCNPLPWNDNSILSEGACSWTLLYPTAKPINLDNLPITQKRKWSVCTLYFYLSYWAAFKLKTTWSPNRRWPDSMASIQVTPPTLKENQLTPYAPSVQPAGNHWSPLTFLSLSHLTHQPARRSSSARQE